jgi:TrmH family RNA methyltransferase
MPAITSRQHALVKQFRALQKDRHDEMLIDGWHVFGEALHAGVEIEVAAFSGKPAGPEKAALDRASAAGTKIVEVSSAVMNAMSPVKSPTGLVAKARRPRPVLDDTASPRPALAIATIGVQDPGNVGAIIRSAAAAGATGVAVDAESADPWGWKALRASMGTAFKLPVVRVDDAMDAIDAWRGRGLAIVASTLDGGKTLYEHDFRKPTAFLIGAEGAGLPAELLETADASVTIPMRAGVESLNAAVAAALLIYEARRQRGAAR